MAKLGTSFTKVDYTIVNKEEMDQKINNIKEFIKGLSFKKDIFVLVEYNDEINDVLVDYRKLDYLVSVNPYVDLPYIQKRLEEKGVLEGSEVEHPKLRKTPVVATAIFPKYFDDAKRDELINVLKNCCFKINGKSFLDKFEISENKCLFFLNDSKDLVIRTFLEPLRWFVRIAHLPKELKISIEGSEEFDLIRDNDWFVKFNDKDIAAMKKCREGRPDVFNI